MDIIKSLLAVILLVSAVVGLSTCSEPEEPKPEITQISPSLGPVGTEVKIAGKNLATVEEIKFGTVAAGVITKSATEILTVAPAALVPGDVSVTVKSKGGVSNAISFKVIPSEPEVTSIEPDKGSVGMDIALKGKHLATASSVLFGTKSITTFTSKADTEVKVKVPEGLELGAVNVTVTTEGGTSEPTGFTVVGKPTITEISPAIGPAGRKVSIKGEHLDEASQVFFGTGDATFTIQNATLLEATVPASATTGKVKVITPGGEALSAVDFVVKDPPAITGFTPTSGIAGTTVTINGSNFDGGGLVVKFGNGTATEVTLTNATQLTAKVPATATTGKIMVETLAGSGSSANNFTVIGSPEITSFAPPSGVVGVTVTITGKNFVSVTGIKFNNTNVASRNYSVVSPTQITAKVPAGATTGKITVSAQAGNASSANNFIVIGVPAITSFSPASGAVGATVTITGTNFVEVSAVKFNNTSVSAANYTVNSATQITAKVPAGATTGKISVGTPGGTASSANNFAVVGTPDITTFSPQSGIVGISVTITGKDFINVNAVKFNNTNVSSNNYNVVSPTQINAIVPAGATTGKIAVESPVGTGVSSANFTVIGTPEITSLTPGSGVVGATITITGKDFIDVSAVKFNTTSVTAGNYTVVSPTQITAKVPAGATTGKISVETPAGTATSAANFTVIITPSITSFTPLSGGVGATVTITGQNFVSISGVKFNTTEVIAGNYTVVSPTEITAKVPAGATTGKISITNPAGTGVSAENFTPLYPPTITSFSPANGPQGSNVVITGTNYVGVTAVTFNNQAAGNFTVNSPTQITASVPANGTSGKIAVTNAIGTATSGNDFFVTPFISSINPVSGSAGTVVTITGTNLSNATVRFNSTSVNPTTNSATTITVSVPGGLSGAVNVTVVNAGGTSNSKTFTVGTPPEIEEVVPTFNIAEQLILIRGKDLLGATAVKLDNIDAPIQTNTSKVVTARIPSGTAIKRYSLTVITPKGTSNALNFDVVAQQPQPDPTSPSGVNGASITSIPGGYVPPISNQWESSFYPGDEFFVLSETGDGLTFDVFYRKDSEGINIDGVGFYDLAIVEGVRNNYVEFTLNGIRYVGQWTPPNGSCQHNMLLISTETGKQLPIFHKTFEDGCP